MFLQILFQSVLLRNNSRVVVVIQINIIVLHRVVVNWRMIRGWCRRYRGNAALVLAVLCVVQLFVIEVIQREISGMLMPRWRVNRPATVPRTER